MYPVEPRTFGTLLSDSFSILKRNSGTISRAIFFFWILPLIPMLLSVVPLVQQWPKGLDLEKVDEHTISPEIAALLVAVFLSAMIFFLFAAVGYILIMSIAIGDREEETMKLREHLPPILKRNLWWSLAIFICSLIATELASSPFTDETAFGGIAYVLVSTVLSSILSAKLFMTIPALLLEDRGPLRAIERSWQLTNGYFWKTLGRYLAITFVGGAVVMVPLMIALVIATMSAKEAGAGSLLGSMQDLGTMMTTFLLFLPTLIMTMLVLVIEPIYRSEIYYDLRLRKGEFETTAI
jgi:membrane-anchored glycerophosphoryl diester phosphodiesterase (GDPDase)